MEFYKKGQGRIVRRCALIAILLLAFYGCYTLYNLPPSDSWWWIPFFIIEKPRIIFRPILIPSAAIFLGCVVGAIWFFNRPRVADFLIETEGELKKVSWPQRKEFLTASWVVIVVIIVMSIFLFIADRGLSWILHRVGIGF
jgi:preprotein translocase subunit SecE